MSPLGPGYAADPMVLLYLVCAFLVAGLGGGVYLFERFEGESRRHFLLTVVVALWMAPLGVTHAATTPGVEHLWLRISYLFMPMTVPALYSLGQALNVHPVKLPARAVWAVAGMFVAINAATPWLVDGLQAFLIDGTLGGAGWLGAMFAAYEFVGISGSVALVVRSRHAAMTGEELRERAGLAAAGIIGALPLLDYLVARDPFRAGLITPLALLAGSLAATAVAVRFRVYAPAHSFGTGEVLRTMADAVLVADPVGRIRSTNPAARRLLDRSRSDLEGRPVGEVLGESTEEGWRPWTELGESASEELDLRPADGSAIRVSASVEPIRMGPRTTGAVIVARDIRSRLKAQRALEASQRRYASLFWHNPALLYEVDLEGRIQAVNPAVEAMLGMSSAELRGETFDQLVDPADLESTMKSFQAVTEGEAREYDVAVRTARDERRQLRAVSIPIFEGSEVTGVFGVALDVTEEKRIKRELEVQRRYFADLFESSPEGIVLVDPGTDEVLRMNAEFARMFGYTAEEALGRSLTELIVPEDRAEEGPVLNERARTEGRVRTETVRRRKDGSLLDVSVLARDLQIPGEPRQLYGVYRDISERKAAERTLKQREEELRHAQRLEAVGKLAGGIAHDFNNLLTVINGHARFALEQVPGDSELETELEEIEKAGRRAASLTQQLLAYSRRQVLHPKVLDLNAVVLGLRGMLRRLIGEHIATETRCTDENAYVRADQGQLEQVLVNLVVNARDAMPEGGTLTIETDVLTLEPDDDRLARWEVEAGDFVRLRVSDDGVGMDAETLEHAFDPFFTTKQQGKGTGLGLATVFGIVKQSEGHISLRSEPGVGTVCDVMLPRCHGDVEAVPEAAEAQDGRRIGATVLLVEDEDAVRNLAVRVLEREGCTVLAAENGVRALEVVNDSDDPLDLVLTDLVMPDMGGRELARELRRIQPDVPILFMSGYDDAMVDESGAASDLLAKPFTPKVLARRVAAVLEE